jgi:hypothetical protein
MIIKKNINFVFFSSSRKKIYFITDFFERIFSIFLSISLKNLFSQTHKKQATISVKNERFAFSFSLF